MTKAHASRNQVPSLFLIFARFFRIKIPMRKIKMPFRKVEGNMTFVSREVLYVPGRTHCKEVCATLNQAHKLQMGVLLLETEGDNYCYVADGAESLQSEWLAQLLSRRDMNGKLQVTSLDLNLLHSKTSEAQHAAFKESTRLIAETCRDLGVTKELSPRLVNFKPDATQNDRAATARKAARLTRGGNGSGGEGDVTDDPTCAHHGVTNVLEEGRKAIDKIMREEMNITEEQAQSVATKVKAEGDAHMCGLVQLTGLLAHLPGLEVRGTLLIERLRDRRQVPQVAPSGGAYEGGGAAGGRGAGGCGGHDGHLRFARLCLFYGCCCHRALRPGRQLAHIPRGGEGHGCRGGWQAAQLDSYWFRLGDNHGRRSCTCHHL